MEIKVLGPGCANCTKLEKLATEAAIEVGITDPVTKVTDIKEIMAYGIMSTPGLVIDGKVKSSGRIPTKDEIKGFLQGDVEAITNEGGCSCGGDGCC